MRILVVKNEKNLGAVLGRVTAPNAPVEITARAEAALRAANPGLDFNRLRPGDVLVLPDAPDISAGQGDTVTGAVLGAAVEQAKAGLAQLKRRLDASESGAQTERDTLRRLLASQALTAAMGRDESLKAEVEAVRAALTQEEKDAAERKKNLPRVLEQVAADLEQLRKRFA